jgi:hypothetical protein
MSQQPETVNIELGAMVEWSHDGITKRVTIVGATLTWTRLVSVRTGEYKGQGIQLLLEDEHGKRFWSGSVRKVAELIP